MISYRGGRSEYRPKPYGNRPYASRPENITFHQRLKSGVLEEFRKEAPSLQPAILHEHAQHLGTTSVEASLVAQPNSTPDSLPSDDNL